MLATQLLGVWIAEVLVMVGEILKLHFHLMPQTPYSSKAFLLTVHVEKFHVSLNLYMLPLSFFTFHLNIYLHMLRITLVQNHSPMGAIYMGTRA
jgi:hypothetical protein